MCTCSNQLQPHDRLPRVCPADAIIERYGSFEQPNGSAMIADLRRLKEAAASEQDGDRPFDAWVDLGGEA